MEQEIKLKDSEPFAQGGNRLCFVDPRDCNKCIKVARPGRSAAEKRLQAPVYKRLRSLFYYDDNLRELDSYQRIDRYVGADAWRQMPRSFGMVDTDLGPGIATALVRDANGSISKTLRDRLRRCGYDSHFRAAVEVFEGFLRATALPTRDLLLHNLVAQEETEGGPFRIFLIDGFGSSDLIPFTYWAKGLARRKVERKIQKFHVKIDAFRERESIPYHP